MRRRALVCAIASALNNTGVARARASTWGERRKIPPRVRDQFRRVFVIALNAAGQPSTLNREFVERTGFSAARK